MLSARLKVMLADLGLTPESAAHVLHVTPRTVRHWISGKSTIPYAAYRLLRIMGRWELPMAGWDGWHMHSGKLWSPEGHAFDPHDSNWWSLLVRQARCFRTLYQRASAFDQALMLLGAQGLQASAAQPVAGGALGAGQGAAFGAAGPRPARHPDGAAGRAPEAAGLDLSLRHFGTQIKGIEDSRGLPPGSDLPPSGQCPLTKDVKRQGVPS